MARAPRPGGAGAAIANGAAEHGADRSPRPALGDPRHLGAQGGGLTFRALQDACGGASPTVLNERLRELRESRLVDLADSEGYGLTPLGRELLAVFLVEALGACGSCQTGGLYGREAVA